MVLQSYQNLIEKTLNIIYIVAFGVDSKCPHKIHLNTQWGGGGGEIIPTTLLLAHLKAYLVVNFLKMAL